MPSFPAPSDTAPLLRPAIGCTLIGLLCVTFYLWQGFGVWSFGIGILVGIPMLVVGMGLYVVVVVRDLRRRDIL
ncbi:MAG: hypothetical protein HOP18_28410 [Deltaproteobacteria bacterium]|nr:hypothetical protein [Deltaproteobacteria bacterium]